MRRRGNETVVLTHCPGTGTYPAAERGESRAKTTLFARRHDPRDRESDGSFHTRSNGGFIRCSFCMTVVSTPPPQPWLLYGANGYTGKLIDREAVRRGYKLILAGRARTAIERLAAELGCPSAVFEVHDHTRMVAAMANVAAVLNCAGAFSRTARPVMQACLACHVHYF